MASQMLDKILSAEKEASAKKKACLEKADDIKNSAIIEASKLSDEAKKNAEAKAQKEISDAEDKARQMIKEKVSESANVCESLEENAAKKKKECFSVVLDALLS